MSRIVVGGLDLETTGLSQPDGHRIIEVALSLFDLDKPQWLGNFTRRINPQRGIDPKAEAVHKISYDSLVGKPVWEEVAPVLSKLMGQCTYIVAHNGIGFDAPFLWGEFIRAGVAVPDVRIVDTMTQGRWATPDGAVPNLQALCFASGVPYDTELAHGALYDVEVMMKCFFKHLATGFFTLPTEQYRYVVPKGKK